MVEKRKHGYLVGTILGAGVVVCLAAPAYAGDLPAGDSKPEPAPAVGSQSAGVVNEDVVVTARRRDERIQDVPIAITALSGEQLDRQGITTVEQLRVSVPALTIAPSNFGAYTPSYSIRAQRQGDGILTQDTSVGVYFSDVVQARPNGTGQSLYDIASVQVLKGPQGTLFGRNTTGGAVLITPNKPSEMFEGNISAIAGDYGLKGLGAVINLPVSDKFAVRVAGKRLERDGYVKNLTTGRDLNDDSTTALRVSALATPSDTLENLTVVDYFRGSNGGTAYRIKAVNPAGTIRAFPTLLAGLQGSLARQQARSDYEVENDGATYNRVKVWGVANTTTLDLGFITVKNILGYRNVKTDTATDWDGSSAFAFHNRNFLDEDQWSDELQFLGTTMDEKLKYIFGVYYFRESGHEFQPAFTLSPNLASREADVVNESKSVFAQADYELITNLTATLGLRQTWDSRDLTSFNKDTAAGGPQLGRCRMFADDAGTTRLNPCVRVNATEEFDALTYTVGLNYKLTPEVLVYVAHRKGYRAGGQQLRANRPSETKPFAPENVKDVEAGFKGDFLDQRVRLNIAAYNTDYKNIQRLLAPPCPAPNQTIVCSGIANAAIATVQGVEVEATLRPVKWFDLQGFYSLANAEYERFVTPQGVDLSSKAFAGVPEATYGVTAGLNIAPDSELGDFRVSISYFHQDGVTLSDDNDDSVPGYELVNIGAQWNGVLGSPVDLNLNVNNVTDESYATGGIGIFPSFGFKSETIGDPRNWTLTATYRF